jgi:1-acyl-sn-glycerol-3-phosphate acyltransferase
MWKYIRILWFVGLPMLWSYVTFILPNLWFRKSIPLAQRYRQLQGIVNVILKAIRIDLIIKHESYRSDEGPYYFVSDHTSMLDPFLFVYLMKHPTRFIAKKQLQHQFIFGQSTDSIDAVFIDRKNVRQAAKALQVVKASLNKQETHWVIYPEGTRNRQPETSPMLEFKPGSFKMAMDAKATIVLAPMYGTHRPLKFSLDWKRYPVQIDFLTKITPAMYEGKSTQEVALMAYNLMQTRLNEMKIFDQIYIQNMRNKGRK